MPPQLKFSGEEDECISLEIERLKNIGAIAKSSHENGEFVSNIFPRPKSNGKTRVILNLKNLNKFLSYKHFKMEHLDFVFDLVRENDWFCSIDMADAYFAVNIHPDRLGA